MATKQVQIGSGIMVCNDHQYSRITWRDDYIDCMGERTKEWYLQARHLISEDRLFLNASPGMLMGMLNAASTTVGLLPENHRMEASNMRVITLRSSDDFMTTYLAGDEKKLNHCLLQNRINLGLVGINLSPDKTFFFSRVVW